MYSRAAQFESYFRRVELRLRRRLGDFCEDFRQFAGMIHDDVRSFEFQCMRGKSVGDGDRPEPGVVAGADIDVRVANDGGLVGSYASFGQQFESPSGSGFFVAKLLPP